MAALDLGRRSALVVGLPFGFIRRPPIVQSVHKTEGNRRQHNDRSDSDDDDNAWVRVSVEERQQAPRF
jgi:hypothetical protein